MVSYSTKLKNVHVIIYTDSTVAPSFVLETKAVADGPVGQVLAGSVSEF